MAVDLQGKVALVTGASRGIGRAIALELAGRGAQVAAIGRDAAALAALQVETAGTITPLVVDLTSQNAFDDLRREVAAIAGRLDILIGNAAIMGPRTTLAALADADWDGVIAANVSANWRLIRRFDALLRASDAGRAVFITSGSGSRGELAPGRGAYAISKAALDAVARSYASETADSAVKVMLCNPGPLRTGMRASIRPDEDPLSLRTPAEFAPKVAAMCLPQWTVSGALYDFPQDRVLRFRGPE